MGSDVLQGLLDRAEIEDLRARYALCSDNHLFDELAELYAPDGVVEVAGQDPVAGRDLIREFYKTLPSIMGEWSHHYTTSSLTTRSDQTAEGKVYWLVPANWPDGRAHLEAGVYDDEYRKIDGRWHIQRRTCTWFWSRFMDWDGDWRQVEPLS
jgi:ketosteroid isomerase-like protein